MKPVQLVMSAFGPFADKVIIDFSQLGDAGLYLVTGDTGAGKTTIFDAIAYALYGVASGEYREGKMLRSEYADKAMETFVELTFSVKGKEYVIRRSPEYMIWRESKKREVKQDTAVQLVFPDDRVTLTKQKDVEDAIIEIVGLDCNQFSQITMLAQGEFRKLLLSTTKDKLEVFRSIFMTGAYGELQRQLKECCGEKRKSYENQGRDLLKEISFVECGEDFLKKEELEEYKKNQQLVQKEVLDELIEELLQVDLNQSQSVKEQLKALEQALQELDREIGIAGEHKKAQDELLQIDLWLNELKGKHKECQERAQQAEEEAKNCDQLQEQMIIIREKLEDYQKHTLLKQNMQCKQKELEDVECRKLQNKKELELCDRKETELSANMEANKNAEKEKLVVEQEILKVREEKSALDESAQQYFVVEKAQDETLKAKDNYLQEREMCEYLEKEYAQKEKQFFDAQAGILAENLEVGKPCPVCGSLEHPIPAKKVESVMSRQELETEKQKLEVAKQRRESASLRAGRSEEQFEQCHKQWIEQVKRLLPGEVLQPLLSRDDKKKEIDETIRRNSQECERKVAALQQKLVILEQAKQEFDRVNEELPKLKNRRTELDAECQKLELDSVAKKTEWKHLSEQCGEIEKGLHFANEQDARLEIDRLQTSITALQEARKHTLDELSRVEKEQHEQEGRRKVLVKQLSGAKVKGLEELQTERQQMSVQQNSLQKAYNIVSGRYNRNQQLALQIQASWKQYEKLEQEYMSYEQLSKTANGELHNKDKYKIKLETYVQTSYFDRVLSKANLRLLGMTDGQYELVRSKEARDKKSQAGLDLNVYDYYSASERSVQTLSGGETFMASLALALGLADEIQESAGGVQINTLFVDEGFGSLDDETLKRAMKELDKLTEGNRLVGIISHVADLKSWIDKQVVVSKVPKAGSTVRIIV